MKDTASTGAVDSRMIATMRIVLASSALLIIYLDPLEPDRLVPITYGALILYNLYSVTLYALVLRHSPLLRVIERWSHWADVCWYSMLIALSSGTNSLFFFFFFFSILVASFRWGFASGLRVAVASSILFMVTGYLTAPSGPEFELNRFLLRPIYMLVLGYMIAYWGGLEIILKCRLAMLKEVNLLSNPRFGVQRTIGVALERLRAFSDADTCVLIMTDLDTGEYRMCRAERADPEAATKSEVISADLACEMLRLPHEQVAICEGGRRRWGLAATAYQAYDLSKGERSEEGKRECQKLTNLLDARSVATVPLRYRSEVVGRVYLTSKRRGAFDRSDAEFLVHVFEQLMPVIENIRLVDRLASDAAEHERQRIARDIHDSVIQPYIGLQIGLSAIEQKLERPGADVRGEVRRLIGLTDLGITDLRHYVRALHGTTAHEDILLPSVRRYTAKFAEATGITVNIEEESAIQVNDRLAAEAFQMVAEGLSNIRRHTRARRATIRLASLDGKLILRIENDVTSGAKPPQFTPRSIADRAAALGGQAQVEQRDGTTVIKVEIPL